MRLVTGIPDPVEFHLDMSVFPETPVPGRTAVLQFFVRDPWKDRPVSGFNVVHERFFHAFVVSEDLEFFEHGGPQMEFEVVFPRPGVYRVWIQLQTDNTVNTVHFDVPVGVQANLEPVTESQ